MIIQIWRLMVSLPLNFNNILYYIMFLGFFALVNANEDHQENSVANMNSPIFERSDDTFCINFWFYASAPNIGSLNILKTKANDDSIFKVLWSFLTGDSTDVSNLWQEGQVPYLVRH